MDTVEKERKKTDEAVKKTKEESERSLKNIIGIAQATWDLTTSIAEGAGLSLSLVTKAVVQSAFAIASTIRRIAQAEAITPFLQAQAVFSFIGAGLALAAAFAAQTQQTETSQNIATGLTRINQVNSYIGLWYNS